jgi:hypothetical protein
MLSTTELTFLVDFAADRSLLLYNRKKMKTSQAGEKRSRQRSGNADAEENEEEEG